jgi:hypothetical protein
MSANKIEGAPSAIPLKFPLATPSGTITTLTLRRGTVRDLKAAQGQSQGNPAELELALIAQLTEEKLTIEDLEGMDLADYAEVQARFSELVGNAV